ncbi:MAG: type II toxin-antitoxin system RelE/ParE family toxin [Thermodesulfobacteriota bacterium]|nr:type II toxin-antitoxin system RelE/ParE family toxin [Thermodesulfobacteriota bacterium]
MGRQLTLMAYRIEDDALVLYQVGPHENFYKNLTIPAGNRRLKC